MTNPLRLVLISDTHNRHGSLTIPPCDLLLHAGDWSIQGTEGETRQFLEWFGRQPARVRALTPGNHDLFARSHNALARSLAERNQILWLEEQGASVLGLSLWASPFTPVHGTWAFQAERGPDLASRWQPIPDGLDILITHGPPHGVLDRTWRGQNIGCEALRDVVLRRRPRLHVFGHVHEEHGEATLDGCPTRFLNVCSSVFSRVKDPTSTDVHPPTLVSLSPR